MASKKDPESLLFVLDASAIVNGADCPATASLTTPSVVAEFSPGGSTRRRLDLLLAAGLTVREPSPEACQRVRRAAEAAGNVARLSPADIDIVALGIDAGSRARLMSDDFTVLDVARRLGIHGQPIATRGIRATLDWGARCRGCGRSYGADQAGTTCPVCGSEVQPRPRPHK